MEKKKGTYRTAFLFEGVVFKVAAFRMRLFLRASRRIINDFIEYRHISWMDCYYPPTVYRGPILNWSEFVFYLRNRMRKKRVADLLAPSYLSLLGFLNIQRRGAPLRISFEDFQMRMRSALGDTFWKNPHTFADPDNFVILDGRIKIVDYGDERVQEVLLRFPEEIAGVLDEILSDSTSPVIEDRERPVKSSE